jgi:hypothetical protein
VFLLVRRTMQGNRGTGAFNNSSLAGVAASGTPQPSLADQLEQGNALSASQQSLSDLEQQNKKRMEVQNSCPDGFTLPDWKKLMQ